jgi:hypothetical protein
LNLNINAPNFKKSSKASQNKVGFGKSRPSTAKEHVKPFAFYENNYTIENKCFQDLIKDRKNPGSFLTKCDRFHNNR